MGNNFSPNDEGLAAPLHIFEHHGIQKNGKQFPQTVIETVDEAMTEEDQESSPSRVSGIEVESFTPALKSSYFGCNTL